MAFYRQLAVVLVCLLINVSLASASGGSDDSSTSSSSSSSAPSIYCSNQGWGGECNQTRFKFNASDCECSELPSSGYGCLRGAALDWPWRQIFGATKDSLGTGYLTSDTYLSLCNDPETLNLGSGTNNRGRCCHGSGTGLPYLRDYFWDCLPIGGHQGNPQKSGPRAEEFDKCWIPRMAPLGPVCTGYKNDWGTSSCLVRHWIGTCFQKCRKSGETCNSDADCCQPEELVEGGMIGHDICGQSTYSPPLVCPGSQGAWSGRKLTCSPSTKKCTAVCKSVQCAGTCCKDGAECERQTLINGDIKQLCSPCAGDLVYCPGDECKNEGSTSNDPNDFYPHGKNGYYPLSEDLRKKGWTGFCIDPRRKGPRAPDGSTAGVYICDGGACNVIVGQCCDYKNRSRVDEIEIGHPSYVVYNGQMLEWSVFVELVGYPRRYRVVGCNG